MSNDTSSNPETTGDNGHLAEKNPVDYPREEWLKKVGLEPDDLLPELDLISAEDVEIKPVEWLWENRIPKGKLTMFDGDPDVGKSVVTMDIAARVSTGRGFADHAKCEPGMVLIANVEDATDDTIVPRLQAHGADLSKVKIINGVPDGKGGTRLLDLPADAPILRKAVKKTGAVLVIVDPVLTMLGGDANKDQDARKALTPLKDLAEETGVAIVAVRHLNKNVSLAAIQRGGGNMGLIGVARAGAFFAHHPDEDGLRVMAQHKNNLGPKPASLQYKVVGAGPEKKVARVEWCGETAHDANSLSAESLSPHEKSALDEAKEFLQAELEDGPMWAKQVYKDARDAGVTDATLRRAKTELMVKSEKVGGDGWQWSLPDKPDRGPGKGAQSEGAHEGAQRRSSQTDEHLEHVERLPIDKPNSRLPDEHLQNGDEHLPVTPEALYIYSNNVEEAHEHLPDSAYLSEDAQGAQDAQGEHVRQNAPNKRHSSSLATSAPGLAKEDITKSGDAHDRLTPEEVEKYKRLRTKMRPEKARAKVIDERGKDERDKDVEL